MATRKHRTPVQTPETRARSSTTCAPDMQTVRKQSSTLCESESQSLNCLTGRKISGFKSSRRRRRFMPYTRETPEDFKYLYSSLYKTNADVRASRNKKKTDSGHLASWNELTVGRWKLHDVSPLHNFDSSAASLKFYSRHLSATVAGLTRNITSIDEAADCAEVLISDCKSSRSDGFAIEFKMYQKTGVNQSTTPGSKGQIVLRAYLFSIFDPLGAGVQGLAEGFTAAPLLLVKGSVRLTNVLMDWIKARFDCCVTVHSFTSVDLCWLVAMFSGVVPDKSAKSVQLVYKVPDECSGLSTFTYEIKPKDCQRLWKSLHPYEHDDRFTASQAMSFIKALENHFYHYFKIKLAAMKIVHVETPTFSIDTDGRIKIYIAGRAEQLLACIEQFSCTTTSPASVDSADIQQQQSDESA